MIINTPGQYSAVSHFIQKTCNRYNTHDYIATREIASLKNCFNKITYRNQELLFSAITKTQHWKVRKKLAATNCRDWVAVLNIAQEVFDAWLLCVASSVHATDFLQETQTLYNINTKNINRSAYMTAAEEDSLACIEILWQAGLPLPSITTTNTNLPQLAKEGKYFDIQQALLFDALQALNLQKSDFFKEATPLFMAAAQHNIKQVRLWLERAIQDIQWRNLEGYNALGAALHCKPLSRNEAAPMEIAKLLLQKNISLVAVDRDILQKAIARAGVTKDSKSFQSTILHAISLNQQSVWIDTYKPQRQEYTPQPRASVRFSR